MNSFNGTFDEVEIFHNNIKHLKKNINLEKTRNTNTIKF